MILLLISKTGKVIRPLFFIPLLLFSIFPHNHLYCPQVHTRDFPMSNDHPYFVFTLSFKRTWGSTHPWSYTHDLDRSPKSPKWVTLGDVRWGTLSSSRRLEHVLPRSRSRRPVTVLVLRHAPGTVVDTLSWVIGVSGSSSQCPSRESRNSRCLPNLLIVESPARRKNVPISQSHCRKT